FRHLGLRGNRSESVPSVQKLLSTDRSVARDCADRPNYGASEASMTASPSSNRNSTQAGFTLVEIAIVLVIIGLLLGGILKGQEMITQARIKNAINDFNGITVAVTSYQDRYRGLPGDDKGA